MTRIGSQQSFGPERERIYVPDEVRTRLERLAKERDPERKVRKLLRVLVAFREAGKKR